MSLGDDVGKGAVEEFEQNALPRLINEFNSALALLNTKSAQIMDLGGKILSAVQTLLPLELKGSVGGIPFEFTLRKPK